MKPEQFDYEKYYNDCLLSLHDCRKSSESDFEDKISYITAGALGVSIALFKDYGGCDGVWLLLISWWSLLFSLLVNCLSAYLLKAMCVKVIGQIKEVKSKGWCKNFNKPIERLNSVSDRCNQVTIACSLVGIAAIVIFMTIIFF